MTRILLLVLAFGTASGMVAADFGGRWAGTVVTARGQTAPIYLTVSQQGGVVSGILITVEPKSVPLSDAVVREDELRFRVSENGQTTAYSLTMVVTGNPSFDGEVALHGAATSATGQSIITLYPVGESLDAHGAATPPSLIYKVDPRYTESARAAKIEGPVVLKVVVEETGMLAQDQIQVIRGLGYGLDEAAVECVKQWRFKPAFRSGYAVKTPATLEVSFRP